MTLSIIETDSFDLCRSVGVCGYCAAVSEESLVGGRRNLSLPQWEEEIKNNMKYLVGA